MSKRLEGNKVAFLADLRASDGLTLEDIEKKYEGVFALYFRLAPSEMIQLLADTGDINYDPETRKFTAAEPESAQ